MISGALANSYDPRLVALSVFIAVLASYAALDLAGRVTSSRGTATPVADRRGHRDGLGIWSMHYIGMLAFLLPMPVQYDWPTVLLSLFAAILASAVALFVVSRKKWARRARCSAACSWAAALRRCITSAWRRCASAVHTTRFRWWSCRSPWRS